jgi:hypothetical protein
METVAEVAACTESITKNLLTTDRLLHFQELVAHVSIGLQALSMGKNGLF